MLVRWVIDIGGPTLLFALAILPVYLLGGRVIPQLMDTAVGHGRKLWNAREKSERTIATAVVLAILLGILWLLWILPLAFCLWSQYWVARRWKVVSVRADARLVQVANESGAQRFCERCRIFMDDRTYHCRELDKCLPNLDHTCFWWTGAVWAYNMKAYLLFIFFLPWYQLFVLVVSIWILANHDLAQRHPYAWAGIAAGLGLFVSTYVTSKYWRHLVWYNVLEKEKKHGIYFRTDEGHVQFWDPESCASSNPWNQGLHKNFRSVMGPWWSCLFFWSTTSQKAKVRWAPAPHISQGSAATRREHGTSTGFEDDVELGNLTRRTRSNA